MPPGRIADIPEGRHSRMSAAKSKKKGGLLTAVVILLLIFLCGMQLSAMHEKIADAEGQRDTLTSQLADRKQENASLEAALKKADDPEYLQQLARDQLGMVSPGEKDFYDVSN